MHVITNKHIYVWEDLIAMINDRAGGLGADQAENDHLVVEVDLAVEMACGSRCSKQRVAHAAQVVRFHSSHPEIGQCIAVIVLQSRVGEVNDHSDLVATDKSARVLRINVCTMPSVRNAETIARYRFVQQQESRFTAATVLKKVLVVAAIVEAEILQRSLNSSKC